MFNIKESEDNNNLLYMFVFFMKMLFKSIEVDVYWSAGCVKVVIINNKHSILNFKEVLMLNDWRSTGGEKIIELKMNPLNHSDSISYDWHCSEYIYIIKGNTCNTSISLNVSPYFIRNNYIYFFKHFHRN